MILIDEKEIDWTKFTNGGKKFSIPHTWTIAPHMIKYDFTNMRHQCPDVVIPTEYRSSFQYGHDQPKRIHKVEYREGLTVYPGRPTQMLRTPQSFTITGGYDKEETNMEINFFYFYAPFRVDGIATEKNKRKIIFLYDSKKVMEKSETEAEITMNMLQRIMKLDPKTPEPIIAMAKLVQAKSKVNTKFTIDQEVLEIEDDVDERKSSHLLYLKQALYNFALTNANHLKDLLKDKEATIYQVVEKARASEILFINSEGIKEGEQGFWTMNQLTKTGSQKVELCTIADNVRPLERLVQYFAKPSTSEKDKSIADFEILKAETEKAKIEQFA